MIDLSVQQRSLKLVQDALNTANKKTNWAVGTAESKAMYYICRSGAKAVKPKSMVKKRAVVSNPDRTGRGKTAKGYRYAVKILRQGKPPKLVPVWSKSPKLRIRKIDKLGLAAKAFRLASAVFQAVSRREKVRTQTNLFDAKQFGVGDKVNARLEIFLSYIEKFRPGAVNRAIRKGMASFVRAFDRDWATAIKEGGW